MEVELHIGFPLVKERKSSSALWVLVGQPVSVEVKPVVVCSAVRDGLGMLAIAPVETGVQPSVAIGPISKSV